MWYGDGGPTAPIVSNPQPIHGTMTKDGAALTIEGRRVLRNLRYWVVATDTNPVSAWAREVELADGSRWIVIRTSSGNQWTGERIG